MRRHEEFELAGSNGGADPYEAPQLTVLGSLSELTLGTSGTKADAITLAPALLSPVV